MPSHEQIIERYREFCLKAWTGAHGGNESQESHAWARLEVMKFFLVPDTFTEAAFERKEVYRQGEMAYYEKQAKNSTNANSYARRKLEQLRNQ